MKRLFALVLAAGLTLAAAAQAQTPETPNFPIRPISSLTADTREADALITASGHPALFQNVTDHRGPAVLHKASGMVCRFFPDHRDNRITVYRFEAGIEDVSCGTVIDGVILTHYAYRYPTPPSAEQEIYGAVAAIRNRNPELADYEGEIAKFETKDYEPGAVYAARGVIQINGQSAMTKAMVSQVDGWTLKQRMTVRLDQALHGDLWSEVMMMRLMMDVAGVKTAVFD